MTMVLFVDVVIVMAPSARRRRCHGDHYVEFGFIDFV